MGISCYYHDSALAVVDEDSIRFAIHEERLSRVKHDARFPVRAIGAALDALQLDINDFDRIVFYEDPAVKLDRLWDQVIDYWPRSRRIFDESIPKFVQHKLPVAAQLNPDSPDGMGAQGLRPWKRWRNRGFLLSPVGSVRTRLSDPV